MQAIVRERYGGPEQLVLTDLPTPVPEEGEVLIKVRAFGINRAEIYMREGLYPPQSQNVRRYDAGDARQRLFPAKKALTRSSIASASRL